MFFFFSPIGVSLVKNTNQGARWAWPRFHASHALRAQTSRPAERENVGGHARWAEAHTAPPPVARRAAAARSARWAKRRERAQGGADAVRHQALNWPVRQPVVAEHMSQTHARGVGMAATRLPHPGAQARNCKKLRQPRRARPSRAGRLRSLPLSRPAALHCPLPRMGEDGAWTGLEPTQHPSTHLRRVLAACRNGTKSSRASLSRSRSFLRSALPLHQPHSHPPPPSLPSLAPPRRPATIFPLSHLSLITPLSLTPPPCHPHRHHRPCARRPRPPCPGRPTR